MGLGGGTDLDRLLFFCEGARFAGQNAGFDPPDTPNLDAPLSVCMSGTSLLTLRAQRVLVTAALIFGVALGPSARAQKIKDLKPQGYVDDFANVLSSGTKQKLNALCAEVDQKAQAQLAVVTVKSLNGESVEQFSIDLATQWGVGPKQQSRGVMILVAPNDRKYRIEVGYGLEPILPDGKVGGFGRQAVPYLQHNDFDGAISLMTQQVASAIAADKGITLDSLAGAPRAPARVPDSSRGMPIGIRTIFTLIFLLFPLLGFILRLLFSGRSATTRSRRYGGWWMGGPWYGGGLGGGSWGGGGGFGGSSGGFGGFGGGSFGGGGASGSW